MNSRRISLAIATVVTILSGTTLPSHAQQQSCPLGFTAGEAGCQKVVKVVVGNVCPTGGGAFTYTVYPGAGLDRCDSFPMPPIADPIEKKKALRALTREIDPGFTNPGNPSRQRKVAVVSERVLIDYNSAKMRDSFEVTFEVVILPSSPF
jgi:hypothetical protein